MMRVRPFGLCCLLLLALAVALSGVPAFAQSESATISGRITDPTGAVVSGAEIVLESAERGTSQKTTTNEVGIYVFSGVRPGIYHVTVHKQGFKSVSTVGLVANVQDHIAQNYGLSLGAASESVTVSASAVHVDTTSPAVATTIDPNFVDHIPLNGRTLQNLIALTPGALPFVAGANAVNVGQISVNGLRTTSNYMTIDGVSANINAYAFNTGSGQTNGLIPGFSQFGTTNNLVSVDALQEFKLQSSSYSAELGRTAGGQIQLTTKSGTNNWHGSLYEYFRNDALDSADWFVRHNNLAKPALRHNLFGGTFSGPIWKNKTFFFFSHESVRMRLPTFLDATVPSQLVRSTAAAVLKPYFDAIPQPTGPDSTVNDLQAPFVASFSNREELDATSIRIDHSLTKNIKIFGRYNVSPQSNSSLFPTGGSAFNSEGNTKTLTAGANITLSSTVANELRFNWSRNLVVSNTLFHSFNGSTQPDHSLLFPSVLTGSSSSTVLFGLFGSSGSYQENPGGNRGLRRQINISDNLSWLRGKHLLKFGGDYRQSPSRVQSPDLSLRVEFGSLAAIQTATATSITLSQNKPNIQEYGWKNFSLFAEDTWKVTPRLSLDYGLRWDVNPPPDITPALRPVFLDFVSPAKLLPAGTELYPTIWHAFAPRFGAAYLVRGGSGWETVVRGGYGWFYDSGSGSFGNVSSFYPLSAFASTTVAQSYPIAQATLSSLMTLATASPNPPYSGSFFVQYDKDYVLPRIHQWNMAVEQGLSAQQKLSVTYVGNAGRRLLRLANLVPISRTYPIPSPDFSGFGTLNINSNAPGRADSSDYHAMQVQFNRRSKRLNILASYTWSHAIDTGSSNGDINATSFFALSPDVDRGNSAFDRRHVVSTAFTWNLPSVATGTGFNRVLHAVTADWSFEGMIQAQSAMPITNIVYQDATPGNIFNNRFLRPDLVPGVPLWIDAPGEPRGKKLNPAAFSVPTTSRQGTLARNQIRAWGFCQPDIALGRDFHLTERVGLRFKAEIFNFVNHPQFYPPNGNLGSKNSVTGAFTRSSTFGNVTAMLNTEGVTEGTAVSSQYQVGGPRSVQFSLRLSF